MVRHRRPEPVHPALDPHRPQRTPSLPDVPTLVEAGVKDFVFGSWGALLAPTRTARPIVDQPNQALITVIGAPDMRERLATLGIVPVARNSPEDFGRQIVADLDKNRGIVQGAKIQGE